MMVDCPTVIPYMEDLPYDTDPAVNSQLTIF